MKLVMKSLGFALIISVIFSSLNLNSQCSHIRDNLFRLHILANSDEKYDQELKLKVRDKVLKYTEGLYLNAENSEEAKSVTEKNIDKIVAEAEKVIQENGYNYKVKAEIKKMYFDTRYYENYTIPAGKYEALRLTIGKGEGHNWWCVMFPQICLPAAGKRNVTEKVFDKSENDFIQNGKKYEIKFKVVEWYERLSLLFFEK